MTANVCDAPSARDVRMRASTSRPGFWPRLRLAAQVRRERRALSQADARMLADIGLSRADVWREVNRSFWDLPNRG